jgi:DNA phosphorothioation-dependent restriction protein DptH
MDGIYSAAREIEEAALFKEALRLAARQITNQQGKSAREFAERAVRKARGFGQRYSVSPWQEFDYYLRVADQQCHPGSLLWLLGLWPVHAGDDDPYNADGLEISRLFVDRLLGTSTIGQAPSQRIESLRLLNPTEQQRFDLGVTRLPLRGQARFVGIKHRLFFLDTMRHERIPVAVYVKRA